MQVSRITDTAKHACLDLGKPSQANSKVLSRLFPSYSSKKSSTAVSVIFWVPFVYTVDGTSTMQVIVIQMN